MWLLAVSGQLLKTRVYLMKGRVLLADVTHTCGCDTTSPSLLWHAASPRHVVQVTRNHISVVDTWRLAIHMMRTCCEEVLCPELRSAGD